MTTYVIFQTTSDKCVKSEDCTTRWNNNIKVSIPISGLYQGKYTNLMIMDGEEKEIQDWIDENKGKVKIISEDKADKIGQIISPEGVITTSNVFGNQIKLKSGLFTIKKGQVWSEIK